MTPWEIETELSGENGNGAIGRDLHRDGDERG
jgi:hypothetical protein